MPKRYVIEHMEPETTLSPWVNAEYGHMAQLLKGASQLVFTRVSTHLNASFPENLRSQTTPGTTDEWLKKQGIDKSRICLLDPSAPIALSPSDSKFDLFLFGGILGDDPPRDRTKELRQLGYEGRHLDKVQMTTDTALAVTRRVIEDQVKLDNIPYVDYPTIQLDQHESVEMPFRYISHDGTPIMPPGMRELLKADMDKSFV